MTAAHREINLYTYQEKAVQGLRDGIIARHRRQVLVSPTGSGKTEMAMKIIVEAVRKEKVVWFIVDRIALADQASVRFFLYGIDHGVMQADHPLTDKTKLVQIVSAQTLRRRSGYRTPNLIIWDECHCSHKAVLDLIARHPEAKVIGLTATPFAAGMAEQWDGLVNSITVNRLLEQGYLCRLQIKTCVTPDMKGAKTKSTGEYDDEDAGERGVTIIGNVVETWIAETHRCFGGPVKTIVFSPSVKHGAELCRKMAEAGYNFQQISYLDKDEKSRKAKIEEFRRPDSAIHGLVSCAVLTKGFDQPDVKCGISCKPYRKSFSSHVQEMGRVMRTAPEKEFGLWLCHSGNVISFAEDTAWLFEYGVDTLSNAARQDGQVREPQEAVKRRLFCHDCGTQMEVGREDCPACGWQRPKRNEIRYEHGELIDFEHSTKTAFKPRSGLHAACLVNPRRIWNAALAFTLSNGTRGAEAARKWAYSIWCGVYPGSKLPQGLFDAACDIPAVSPDEWSLIDREVKRFRKSGKTKRRAA